MQMQPATSGRAAGTAAGRPGIRPCVRAELGIWAEPGIRPELGIRPGPGIRPRPGIRAEPPVRQASARVRVRRARALALLLVAAFLLLLAPGLARGDGPERPVARVTYTVQAGDTLWGIARRAAPDRDPREVVDQLVRDNRLDGLLQPGQQLSLPVPSR